VRASPRGLSPSRRFLHAMIFIDAREGLSGDMLLAAMLGLLDESGRASSVSLLTKSSAKRGIEFRFMEMEEDDQKGFGIAYVQPEPASYGASRDECYARLDLIESEIGSGSPIGKKTLDNIFEAEAEAHAMPVADVHLHEIGRTQALINIAGIGLVSTRLSKGGDDEFVCSTIATGMGVTVVSHGAIRIPAPASTILLKGLRHEPGGSPGERATPTGIATVKALSQRQAEPPHEFSKKSVGFGTRRFAGRLGRTTLLRV